MSLPPFFDSGRPDPKTPDPSIGIRSYKACAACRARKVRCIVERRVAGQSCVQCLKDSRDCVFEAKKRSYDTSTRTKKAHEKRTRLLPSETPPTQETLDYGSLNVRSSADALLVLSGAAASHGNESDLPINHSELAGQRSASGQRDPVASDNQSNDGRSDLSGNKDARGLLNSSESSFSPSENPDIQNRISSFRCRLFSESIVTAHESLVYISFFFKHLYPFFPFLPDAYYTCVTKPELDPQEMRSLFEEDDILLGCLITVSSRYYHLPHYIVGGFERSCEIHNQCWHWTRYQVSKVIFEGIRPKSILSVVETLLILAEWLPRPIHAVVGNSDTRSQSHSGQPASTSQFVGDLILQPAFQTDQVSWSYLGNAFLLLRSVFPSRKICPVFKTSNRYLVTFFGCLIMCQSLARRLSRRALMNFDDVDITEVSEAFHERNCRLRESSGQSQIALDLSLGVSNRFHDAFVELMKLLAHTQDVLHPPPGDGIVQPQAETPGLHPRLVTLLQHFDMMNENWRMKYAYLVESDEAGMSTFSKVILQVDFEYLRLYEFSVCLGAYSKIAGNRTDMSTFSGQSSIDLQDNDWEFPPTSLAYYMEQAIDSAESLLRLMLHFHSPLGMNTLKYASSRYYMKIVFAAVFLIQTLRTGIPSLSYQEILTSTLKDTIAALERCSIDAAHPALRYSILLRGLMRDIERPKSSNTPSFIPFTIGPRAHRQSSTLLHEISINSGNSLCDRTSRHQAQAQADFTGGLPPPGNGIPHWQPSTGYAESSQWPGLDFSISEWDDSMAQLDTDTFLQSLMGTNILPIME